MFYFSTASWDHTESVVDFSPNQTEATIIEMNPSTYNIRMFAKNSAGTSRASNVLTVTIEEAGMVLFSSSFGFCSKTEDLCFCFYVFCLVQLKKKLAVHYRTQSKLIKQLCHSFEVLLNMLSQLVLWFYETKKKIL